MSLGSLASPRFVQELPDLHSPQIADARAQGFGKFAQDNRAVRIIMRTFKGTLRSVIHGRGY